MFCAYHNRLKPFITIVIQKRLVCCIFTSYKKNKHDMEQLVLFSGTSIGEFLEEKTIYGNLISVKGHPNRFIQDENGINTPVVVGSEKIKINGKWLSLNDDNLMPDSEEYITDKKLDLIGFKYDAVINEYNYDVFYVRLTDEESEPEIWMSSKDTLKDIPFPGAYTMKDLKDLMFMYYGEEKYTEMLIQGFFS